jgi:hypothetical protein
MKITKKQKNKKNNKNMWSDGVLNKTTVKFIRDGLQNNIRPGRIYFLPKVHKLNKFI